MRWEIFEVMLLVFAEGTQQLPVGLLLSLPLDVVWKEAVVYPICIRHKCRKLFNTISRRRRPVSSTLVHPLQ